MRRVLSVLAAMLVAAGSALLLWPAWSVSERRPGGDYRPVAVRPAGRAWIFTPPASPLNRHMQDVEDDGLTDKLRGIIDPDGQIYEAPRIDLAQTLIPCIACWIPAALILYRKSK